MSDPDEGKGEGEPKGFTVTDRRGHHDDEPAAAESKPTEAPPAAAPPTSAPASLPAMDFSTFVLSLASSTLYHLGELADEDGPTGKKNLPLAKQSIDILGILADKTRGNLTPEEARLLEHLLYDLRLKFVDAKKQ